MLLYFILFGAIGLAVGKLVNDKKVALGIILGIAVLWGMGHRFIWGGVALGELLLGYFLFDVFCHLKGRVKSFRTTKFGIACRRTYVLALGEPQ